MAILLPSFLKLHPERYQLCADVKFQGTKIPLRLENVYDFVQG